jgi:hypothetical protein
MLVHEWSKKQRKPDRANVGFSAKILMLLAKRRYPRIVEISEAAGYIAAPRPTTVHYQRRRSARRAGLFTLNGRYSIIVPVSDFGD